MDLPPALLRVEGRESNMEDSLYDEFGNYIGPELRSSDEEESQSEASDSERGQSDDEQVRKTRLRERFGSNRRSNLSVVVWLVGGW